MKRTAAIVAGTLALVFGMVVRAVAQGQTSEFVPATEIGKEALPAWPLLYSAYAFVWVALVAYVFLLWRRLDRVDRELADVTTKLAGRR